MSDGRINNGGTKGNNGGNPGHGKLSFIKDNVIKYSKDWWTQWEAMMNGDDKDYKKLAMTEFNKLQAKMVPTTFEDEDGVKAQPILVQILRKPDDATLGDTNT